MGNATSIARKMPSAKSLTLNKHVGRSNELERSSWRRTRPDVRAHGDRRRRPFHCPATLQSTRDDFKEQRCQFLYGVSRIQKFAHLLLILSCRGHHFSPCASSPFPPVYPQHLYIRRRRVLYGCRHSRSDCHLHLLRSQHALQRSYLGRIHVLPQSILLHTLLKEHSTVLTRF